MVRWKPWGAQDGSEKHERSAASSGIDLEKDQTVQKRWGLGILQDKETDEVPGSVLLLSKVAKRNEPLGLQHAPARTSHSSLPSPYPSSIRSRSSAREEKKRTKDGKIILEPQPEETPNDPLNWPTLRRDAALLSLGFYCMVGGGVTPILAAGFTNVAQEFDISTSRVALTTGLYMMGLGVGSVIASPTAILFGKRPVYLAAILLFFGSAIWCAQSPSFVSLMIARIVQGIAVSPVECLPSASIAEIFFLHERAYRLGIYTLLLLGGKNLVPLVSAAIIQSKDWRWVFYVLAIVVGFCFFLVFFFVPETFWDRTPRPKRKRAHSPRPHSRFSHITLPRFGHHGEVRSPGSAASPAQDFSLSPDGELANRRQNRAHAHFADPEPTLDHTVQEKAEEVPEATTAKKEDNIEEVPLVPEPAITKTTSATSGYFTSDPLNSESRSAPEQPGRINTNFSTDSPIPQTPGSTHTLESATPIKVNPYTDYYRTQPAKTYLQTLRPWSGRILHDNWFKVALRPFILYAYPAVLWSALVYSMSVGWLIVLSESVAEVYRNHETYNFTALQTGLVYLSPFIGGVLGTAVAGKVSDLIVRAMSRRNDGVYEPEFRLVMALPVAICTAAGLMGFGWSVEERDNFMVPTVFFGIISFGCALGSTTSITFCVDSYRQYAGEALVTLNFSKNIFHGLVFSLFFPSWLTSDGPKSVFLAVGGIQLACMLFTIPMYIFGKRARMWTVRKNLMERF